MLVLFFLLICTLQFSCSLQADTKEQNLFLSTTTSRCKQSMQNMFRPLQFSRKDISWSSSICRRWLLLHNYSVFIISITPKQTQHIHKVMLHRQSLEIHHQVPYQTPLYVFKLLKIDKWSFKNNHVMVQPK